MFAWLLVKLPYDSNSYTLVRALAGMSHKNSLISPSIIVKVRKVVYTVDNERSLNFIWCTCYIYACNKNIICVLKMNEWKCVNSHYIVYGKWTSIFLPQKLQSFSAVETFKVSCKASTKNFIKFIVLRKFLFKTDSSSFKSIK